MPAVAMMHDADPKQAIWDRVGDLSSVEIFGTDILVAIYKRPEKTKSGLILVDQTRGEDLHQGKVGLVLKMGDTCYADPDTGDRYRDINVGDWIVFRPADGWRITLNSGISNTSEDIIDCRMISDICVRGRIQDPDKFY